MRHRETRDAERVRMADLVISLKAEVEELQRRPLTREVVVQTFLTENDLRDNEASALRLLMEKEVQLPRLMLETTRLRCTTIDRRDCGARRCRSFSKRLAYHSCASGVVPMYVCCSCFTLAGSALGISHLAD